MTKTLVERLVRSAICRVVGHRWRVFCDGFKRECRMCGREDWVMSRPYPLIGQAKYYWERMDRTWR